MSTAVFAVCEGAASCAFAAAALKAAWDCGVSEAIALAKSAGIFAAITIAGVALFALHSLSIDASAFAICVATLAVCAATDAATGFVFDAVTFPSLALLISLAALGGHIAASISGALCASGTLLSIYALTRGRGIGLGDVKLAACIGAALGMRPSLSALGIAFVAGAVAGVIALASGRIGRGAEIRFAPYLAAGTIAASVWQPL